MSDNSADLSPAAIAVAFTQAWTNHDMENAARYLTKDVTFHGPLQQSNGIEEYLTGLAAFARAVTGMRVLAALGDDEQALIMYEVTTGPFGTLTCAEHLTFRNGKIVADRLTFDTYAVRMTQANQSNNRPAGS
ncbi:MAG: nuclear transport factor 2 family protein [Chloroflexota bacterium]|nr:nuclear transport factor 2 family protein [Chloroflexota bacterium]